MPCYSPPPTEKELNSAGELSEAQLEAVLCAMVSVYGYKRVNWQVCGVPEETFLKWWKKHQEKDAKRERKFNKFPLK